MTTGVDAGRVLFARYAYAPNALGYCGPAGAATLETVACGGVGAGSAAVDAVARQFSGAWPYQELLAELAGIDDPLDGRVVRGYWTGNEVTAAVDRARFGRELLARLGARAGHYWKYLTDDLLPEAAPTHAFHVFGVYPWTRLLDTGMPQPMHVLDSCRIRNGVVVALTSQTATVRSRGLQFDGRRLALGPLEDRPARRNVGSGSFVPDLRIGDRVAVHWDLICDRLDADEAGSLEHWTDWQLQQTNPRLGRSSERPAAGRGSAVGGVGRAFGA
ncbi:DUF6390 family protein [Prescottella equi]|uniref:Uncharacterized protein n=1 Tax=Rhodococcus hoagii TaxID=43767 RepID=A0AAE5MJE1_RHOHA|nr:DUF6390 family protein [Prescottella equi]MBU4615613.1 hypothetical protein [Rhodococcus sp. GG48]MCD7050828.1 DUF6390 family protein [Rhodococcus sp. BH2-1]ERN43755.1 hypothetical protein H849_21270 [Prescottella equi NBRC 101255 = C 7]MBM4588889.1 hypothetical protein [Prescottella equi]MBM4627932.1 hypothetical protein [Prescottella equi]